MESWLPQSLILFLSFLTEEGRFGIPPSDSVNVDGAVPDVQLWDREV